jgi:hypothetical protein
VYVGAIVNVGTAHVIVASLTLAVGDVVFCPIVTTDCVAQPFAVFVATTVNVPVFVNVSIVELEPLLQLYVVELIVDVALMVGVGFAHVILRFVADITSTGWLASAATSTVAVGAEHPFVAVATTEYIPGPTIFAVAVAAPEVIVPVAGAVQLNDEAPVPLTVREAVGLEQESVRVVGVTVILEGAMVSALITIVSVPTQPLPVFVTLTV